MNGRVNVPFDGERALLMTFDLVATEGVVNKIKEAHPFLSAEAVLPHPTILHNYRFKNNKRVHDLEPEPSKYSWKLDYLIDKKGGIRIIVQQSNLDSNRTKLPTNPWTSEAKVGNIKRDSDGWFFNFENRKGKKKENEISIKPSQLKIDGKDDEPTIRNVLRNRLSSETQQVRNLIEGFYTKKNSRNKKMFRLRVRFYDWDTRELIGTDISDDITDTGDQNVGSMDIFDVTNLVSCCRGGRKITIIREGSFLNSRNFPTQ